MKKLALLLLLVSSLACAGSIDKFVTGSPYPFESGGFGATQTVAMNAQNISSAACFTMRRDDTITTVMFANSAVAGTATSITDDSYTISLQTADSSGLPDGTILGGGSPASATFPQTGQAGGVTLGSNTSHIITLANSIALQAGTAYCLVVRKTGATDAVNYITIKNGTTHNGIGPRFPHTLSSDATPTYTKVSATPVFYGIRSATKTYLYPAVLVTQSQSVGTTTEKGFSFTVPSSFGTSGSVGICGIRFASGTQGLAAANTYSITLYTDPTGTPAIAQQVLQADSDLVSATTSGGYEVYFSEDSLTALAPGTKYGITISTSGATGWSFYTITLPDANSRSAWPMGGLTYMTRTLTDYPPSGNDSSAFTETTTTIVGAELIWCTFTEPSGSSTSIGGVF